jgi:multiple antibiotic resistance protein
VTLLPVWNEHIKFLVGMFAILNPLGTIPIYLSLMAGRSSHEMYRTTLKASVAVAVILTIAVWAGDALLSFFGIGMPAFRIAGGLLVLLIAIAMFGARHSIPTQSRSRRRPRKTSRWCRWRSPCWRDLERSAWP